MKVIELRLYQQKILNLDSLVTSIQYFKVSLHLTPFDRMEYPFA